MSRTTDGTCRFFGICASVEEKKTAPRDQEVMADGTGNNALADESKCVEYGAVNWFSLCIVHTHPS